MGTMADQWIQQGRREGKQEGEAHLLKRILTAKFKEVPESYIKQIDNAKADALNQWATNFVNANSLEDVFLA